MTSPPLLTEEQEHLVHWAVSTMVAAAATRRPVRLVAADLGTAAGEVVVGAFVSLKRRGRLRACCGFFGAHTKLFEAISDASRRTATEDVRLPPVSPTELRYLDLEVWLLSGPTPLGSKREGRASEVMIGRHGLQVRRGKAGGLLLPGVAVEQHLDAEGFLGAVCEKAGLPPTAWKEEDVQISTFEGRSIDRRFDQAVAEEATSSGRTFVTQPEAARLAWHCRSNIMAFMQGRTATSFVLELPDGTVHALSLNVRLSGGSYVPPLSALSLRPGLPLQSTLYTLAERAARSLSSQGIDLESLPGLEVDLTVLWDPAMHGSVDEPDDAGFDASTRALLVMEGTRSAWVYDPRHLFSELVESACREAQVKLPGKASVFSLAAVSTEASSLAAHVPRPQAGPGIRPPAVAGTFYPAEAPALSGLINGLLADSGSGPEPWSAVMVPHAGLMYSGKLAAEVFQRVHIADVVIVLGPRHRPVGMEWAVAPHNTWLLPNTTVPSDAELARQLAEGIPDLHLDALAHRQEHSIEVQLPLLARLAPRTSVIGIVVGAGNLDRCRQFAAGLAEVVRGWPTKPLLVISTDMNHYASEAENRRLDAMALSALEGLDPAEVYHTALEHKISMCGLLPTVMVLETLRQLGTLQTCQRVGYATSADVTGDTRRVVGYAGMLFG